MPSKREDVEISLSEMCPCNSGRKYGKCCATQNFKWMRNPQGRLSRVVPINDALKAVLIEAKIEFRKIFGRHPRKNDPVLIEKYFVSSLDIDREIIQAMRRAGAKNEHIYAYQQTGLLISDPKLATKQDLKEYKSAMDEFRELQKSGLTEKEIIAPDTPIKFLTESLRHVQIIFGYSLDRFKTKANSSDHSPDLLAWFAILNYARCLRSILVLLENDISYDSLILLRTLYESYLSTAYYYKFKELKDDTLAILGLEIGTHRYATNKKGESDYSRIVDIQSGKIHVIPTKWHMTNSLSELDKDLYRNIYTDLCSVAHSDIRTIRSFIAPEEVDYLNIDRSLEVLLLSHVFSALLANLVCANALCPLYIKNDFKRAIHKSMHAIGLINFYLIESDQGKLNPIFQRVASELSHYPVVQKITATLFEFKSGELKR